MREKIGAGSERGKPRKSRIYQMMPDAESAEAHGRIMRGRYTARLRDPGTGAQPSRPDRAGRSADAVDCRGDRETGRWSVRARAVHREAMADERRRGAESGAPDHEGEEMTFPPTSAPRTTTTPSMSPNASGLAGDADDPGDHRAPARHASTAQSWPTRRGG